MKKTQHHIIADLFLEAYPNPICSQGYGRDIALQLPRVINDFRYKEAWQLEDYKPLKENLTSVKCTHKSTKAAADYKLSEKAYQKLKKIYAHKISGMDYVFVDGKPVLKYEVKAQMRIF